MPSLSKFAKRYAYPEWRWYLGGIFFLALTNVVTLLVPQLAKRIIDNLNAVSEGPALNEIALLIVGLGILALVIRALSRVLIFWPGRKIEANSRSDLFAHSMTLPNRFFEQFGLGDLISRLSNDIGHLRVFFAFGVLQALNLIFLLIFTITMMLSIHPKLTVACLTPLLLMVFIIRYANPRMHRFSKANQIAIGKLTNEVTTALVNIHVIKTNTAEKAFQQRVAQENEDVYRTNMKVLYMRQIIWPMITLLAGASQAVVLFYGGLETIRGNITAGDIMAFNVYIAYLGFPLSALGMILALFQRAKTSLERISDIESAHPETGGEALAPVVGAPLIEVRHLSFSFPAVSKKLTSPAQTTSKLSEDVVLKDVSFTLKAGEHLGIYGSIGSGKTTLLNLIMRLYDPPPGAIFFNGQDVTILNPSEIRRQIGYVPQTASLFSDSVAENLMMGFDASNDRLESAARNAQIFNEIQQLPESWDTLIGERGLRLSGGQKQRLSLARAFLRQPPLLLLDDVLSAVDHATEIALADYLRNSRCSLIISSHRRSVLSNCERVMYLERGRVVDTAPLAELERRYPHVFRQESSDA